jgi:hypothetical protein
MQTLVRAAAVAVALWVVLVAGAAAAESGPARVYSDFAQDGTLECGHSEADLRAVLNDASIYQYGDPVTLNRLKLEIRRQLEEGSCPGIGSEESGGLTGGLLLLVGSVLLLLTLGSGGWAARRAYQARR